MDIEGYEEVLFGLELKTPAAIEVSGLQLCDKFAATGWRIYTTNREFSKGYARKIRFREMLTTQLFTC